MHFLSILNNRHVLVHPTNEKKRRVPSSSELKQPMITSRYGTLFITDKGRRREDTHISKHREEIKAREDSKIKCATDESLSSCRTYTRNVSFTNSNASITVKLTSWAKCYTKPNFYWVFCPFFCTPYMYIISVERFLFSYVFWLVFSVFCFKIFATKGAPWEDFTVVLKNHISTETSAWMNLYIFFQQ